MEHSFIDRYSNLSSRLHRLDARTKILAVLIFIIAVVTTPPQHLLAFTVDAGFLLWLVALSQVPLAHVLSRAAMVLPFSALVALGLPFLGGDKTVVVLGVSLSAKGLWLLSGTIMKSFLSVAALVLLVSTTSFPSLLAGLRHLKVSALFTDLLALSYRYLFILIDEGQRLRRAAAARGYKPRWLAHAKGMGQLVGRLFVRSYERSERIYGAMRLRGYNSSMPAVALPRFRLYEGLGLLLIGAMLAAIRIWAR